MFVGTQRLRERLNAYLLHCEAVENILLAHIPSNDAVQAPNLPRRHGATSVSAGKIIWVDSLDHLVGIVPLENFSVV